jgi:hypothetical protein
MIILSYSVFLRFPGDTKIQILPLFVIQNIDTKENRETMRAILTILLAALSFNAKEGHARVYGSYRGVSRPSGVRFSSRLAYNAYGRRRKLLQEGEEEEEEEGGGGTISVLRANNSCPENNTMYRVLEDIPEASQFLNVSNRFPKVVDALKSFARNDTLFVPSDLAIEQLKNWSGYDDFDKFISELWGEGESRARLIAHHAVPGKKLSYADLRNLRGANRYLRDALSDIMPLKVEKYPANVTIRALGSEATIIKPDLIACNGIIHIVDTVLLPFDGDGELDERQKIELRDGIRALFEIDGEGTFSDDVIRKNLISYLIGYDPIDDLDDAFGLPPTDIVRDVEPERDK